MAGNKVLRGDVTIWVAYPEAFADPSAPTSAEMADTDFVHNISCAVSDDYTLNATDSATDDSMSVCDTGNRVTPTFANYEASLDGFIDEDPVAAGVYNAFRDFFRAKGSDYYLIKRLNVAQGSAVAPGHILYLYRVETDNSQLLTERGQVAKTGARFKPQGEMYSDVEVAA